MHNKIYAFIITLLVSVSFCCSAYATAIEGDGLNEIVNEVNSEGSEVLNSEGSEGSSDVGSDISSEVPENLVVDISDESVQAIAEAVNSEEEYQYEFQYEIPFRDTYIVLDTNVANLFDNYRVILKQNASNQFSLYIGDLYSHRYATSCYYLKPSGSLHRKITAASAYFNKPVAFDTLTDFGSSSTSQDGFQASNILWANYHMFNGLSDYSDYDIADKLIYKSPYPGPALISFNTQIEGLSFDSKVFESVDTFKVPDIKFHEDKIFLGWTYDVAGEVPYTPGDEILISMTLYGQWRDAPEWDFIATDFFDSLIAFFTCEPIFYIFSLICMVIIFACIRMIISSRL